MSDELVFECALDAPPEKVWRALTIPEYLERWLRPDHELDLAVVSAEENRSLSYRWRAAGESDSLVTFEVSPLEDGGTWFRLTHAPIAVPAAANSNGPMMMAA